MRAVVIAWVSVSDLNGPARRCPQRAPNLTSRIAGGSRRPLPRSGWKHTKPAELVEAAIEFGPCVEIRDAQIFAIERKEVEEYERDGIDLSDFEGAQVVTASGTVMTVYRNRDFSSLRVRRRRGFRP